MTNKQKAQAMVSVYRDNYTLGCPEYIVDKQRHYSICVRQSNESMWIDTIEVLLDKDLIRYEMLDHEVATVLSNLGGIQEAWYNLIYNK